MSGCIRATSGHDLLICPGMPSEADAADPSDTMPGEKHSRVESIRTFNSNGDQLRARRPRPVQQPGKVAGGESTMGSVQRDQRVVVGLRPLASTVQDSGGRFQLNNRTPCELDGSISNVGAGPAPALRRPASLRPPRMSVTFAVGASPLSFVDQR